MQGARVMLMGMAAATEDPEARRRYLNRQPEAEMFAGFADFAFYRIMLKSAHLVAGFGRIVDLEPQHVLTETGDAGELVAAEPEIVAHMNGDHAEAVRLYATKLMGARDGEWRCVGCDPEGLELQLDRTALRLAVPAARARARCAAPGSQADGRCGAGGVIAMHTTSRAMQHTKQSTGEMPCAPC